MTARSQAQSLSFCSILRMLERIAPSACCLNVVHLLLQWSWFVSFTDEGIIFTNHKEIFHYVLGVCTWVKNASHDSSSGKPPSRTEGEVVAPQNILVAVWQMSVHQLWRFRCRCMINPGSLHANYFWATWGALSDFLTFFFFCFLTCVFISSCPLALFMSALFLPHTTISETFGAVFAIPQFQMMSTILLFLPLPLPCILEFAAIQFVTSQSFGNSFHFKELNDLRERSKNPANGSCWGNLST